MKSGLRALHELARPHRRLADGRLADARSPGGPSRLRRRPVLWCGAFGLLHGLGFAGALAETGLPRDAVPLALAAFNLGIEIGQLALLAPLAAGLALLDRLRPGPIWRTLPAHGLGGHRTGLGGVAEATGPTEYVRESVP